MSCSIDKCNPGLEALSAGGPFVETQLLSHHPGLQLVLTVSDVYLKVHLVLVDG